MKKKLEEMMKHAQTLSELKKEVLVEDYEEQSIEHKKMIESMTGTEFETFIS